MQKRSRPYASNPNGNVADSCRNWHSGNSQFVVYSGRPQTTYEIFATTAKAASDSTHRKEAFLRLWKHLPPCPGGSQSHRQNACSLCPSTSPHITIGSTARYGFHGFDEINAQLNCRACAARVNFHFHFHCVRLNHMISRHATNHSSCCKSVSRKSTMKISSLCRGCPVFCNRLL